MRIAGIMILSLMALFFGGCGLAFWNNAYGSKALSAVGLLLAAVCVAGIYSLLKSPPDDITPMPGDDEEK